MIGLVAGSAFIASAVVGAGMHDVKTELGVMGTVTCRSAT